MSTHYICFSLRNKLELKNEEKEISKLQRVEDELYLLISFYKFLQVTCSMTEQSVL